MVRSCNDAALAFVAHRLGADSVGLVFASREVIEDLDGVPELQPGGLSKAGSRTRLDSVVIGRVDGPVRKRFLDETHGNRLAPLELPRALTPATGVVIQSGDSLSARVEDTDDTRADLTAQESQIARLASEGMTNPEIGAELFLSPRTVEWHLRRVYAKLGISSRKRLRTVLH